MAGAHSGGGGDLARGAIGLREVLFQSITSMAPAGAVALSIAAGATYAGGALPLSVLLALVGCLLVASSIGQLAKHLPSAGSIYTYPAEAIHPALGIPGGLGLRPRRGTHRPDHDGSVRLPVRLGHADRGAVAVHHHLGLLHDLRCPGDRRAQLPRREAERAHRHGPRHLRDPHFPGPGDLAHRQGRARPTVATFLPCTSPRSRATTGSPASSPARSTRSWRSSASRRRPRWPRKHATRAARSRSPWSPRAWSSGCSTS